MFYDLQFIYKNVMIKPFGKYFFADFLSSKVKILYICKEI